MSVQTKTSAAKATHSGCSGCGGDCGGSCCSTPAVGGAFTRPAFFAGQLLTEDDLDALVEYVVGKNRLHNRYLFGDGVVCGLQLSCAPCDPAGIRVSPGYALDCCGNDLLVSCPETLDAKALLRDLRDRQLAGYQCGDPCDPKDGKRRYGLYLRYRETASDSIAPYASSDPCGQQQCQASRIVEGYSFELRCDCDSGSRIDVFKRMLACIGDLRGAATAVARAQTNNVIALQMEESLGSIRTRRAKSSISSQELEAVHAAPAAMEELVAVAAAAEKEAVLPSETAYREKVAEFQKATAAMTHYRALDEDARGAAIKADPDLPKAMEEAEALLADSSAAIRVLTPKVIFDPTAASLATESASLAEKYAVSDAAPEIYENVEAQMMMVGAPISNEQTALMRVDAALLKEWLLERLEDSCSLTTCTLYDRARAISVGTPGEGAHDEAEIAATARAVRELVTIMVQYFVDCICQALNPPCSDCTDDAVLLGCVEIEECKVLDICNLSRRFVLSPTAMRFWLPPLGWFGTLVEKLCCEFDASKLFGEPDREYEHERDDIEISEYRAARRASYGAPKAMMMESYAPVLRTAAIDETSMKVIQRLDLTAKDAENVTALASNLARMGLQSADVAVARLRPGAELLAAKVAGNFRMGPATLSEEGEGLSSAMEERLEATLASERAARAVELETALAEERAASADKIRVLEADAKAAAGLKEELEAKLADERKAMEDEVAAALERERETQAKAISDAVGDTVILKENLGRSVGNLSLVRKLRSENTKLAKQLDELADTVAKLKGGK